MKTNKGLLLGALGMLGAAAGCSHLDVKRDLSATKPGVLVYDDLCGLQDYFDGMKGSTIATPREVFGQDLLQDNGGQAIGGRARFRYETEYQLHHVRKLLAANWSSVPEEVQKAEAIELEVQWSKRAGVKRVVTELPAQLSVGARSWDLPYQACLSDFVYGEDLYNTRRVVLQLPPPPRSPFSKRPVVASNAPAAPAETPAPALAPPAALPATPAAPESAPLVPPAIPAAPAPLPSATH